MNTDPYGELADLMHSSMVGHTRKAVSGIGAVLGTITSAGLRLDDFKHEIQDYLVGEFPGSLTLTDRTEKSSLLSLQRGLANGDRVLVLRINGGNDTVVLCKVVGRDG